MEKGTSGEGDSGKQPEEKPFNPKGGAFPSYHNDKSDEIIIRPEDVRRGIM